MGRKYVRKVCNKCGGYHTKIVDDGKEDPQTFHKDLPEPCKCDD